MGREDEVEQVTVVTAPGHSFVKNALNFLALISEE